MSLLEIKNLHIQYVTSEGNFKAVNGIDLHLDKGETLGLVGETGAGKTSTALGILRLIQEPPGQITEGEIWFDGKNVLEMKDNELRAMRGNDISMIFQDPMTALNPTLRVGDQIAEGFRLHQNCSRKEADERAIEMLEMVGIEAERSREFPHQFSGGMKQRVVIAIALACNPRLLLADEPTTALDVTIQAQVLHMMTDLRDQFNTAMLLITHDLGIVAETCDRVAVMYAGEIVETGTRYHIFKNARHPYTLGLFGSIPSLDKDVKRLTPIPGLMPDPSNLPSGCSFAPRCVYATEKCKECSPENLEIEPGHFVSCFNMPERSDE